MGGQGARLDAILEWCGGKENPVLKKGSVLNAFVWAGASPGVE